MDASILDNAKKFKRIPKQSNAQRSCITIVYAPTGKRIELSKKVHEMLGNAEKVEFLFDSDKKVLIVYPDENGSSVKINKNKAVVYDSELIKEIITEFNLDFENRSSMGFEKFEAVEGKENTVCIFLK